MRRSSATGSTTFLRFIGQPVDSGSAGSRSTADAIEFIDTRRLELELPSSAQLRIVETAGPDRLGVYRVRLQQHRLGVPVFGGQIAVQVAGGSIVSMHAKTVVDLEGVDIAPTVAGSDAVEAAHRASAGRCAVQSSGGPRLELFNEGLLRGKRAPTRLAWVVECSGVDGTSSVWVDAHTGAVLFQLDNRRPALEREVYDSMEGSVPGTLLRREDEPPIGDAEVDRAYRYLGDTYDYFLEELGRDSYDGAGAPMILSVRFCVRCESGAYWYGTQAVFGLNWVVDDLVGHEFTHGIIEHTAKLIYFERSGAVNEAYADIFGEAIDIVNEPDDLPDVAWARHEGVLNRNGTRNMLSPAAGRFPGASRVTAPDFRCTSQDSGGVHGNSAVGGRAFALMVGGGSDRGVTIVGIGLHKSIQIHYRALTNYLVPTSGYPDTYDSLLASCDDLVAGDIVTESDCVEVKKALDAVEMYLPWPCYCGDSDLDEEEECDDGNRIDGDCCSSQCVLEVAGTACGAGDECTSSACNGAGVCVQTEPDPLCGVCPGDCDRSGTVTVDEILKLVSIAIGRTPLEECQAGDVNRDQSITVEEIVSALNHALAGCPQEAG